ncbi:MAG: CocE/NonD family hydrolase [Pseudomonadota bacterium]
MSDDALQQAPTAPGQDTQTGVVKHDTVWISLADGTRLAATIWLPASAERTPVSAVFEFLPYRRRDIKAVRDQGMHAHFAAHGLAGVRVDMRGTGDSDGVIEDEYSPQELADACDVIAWIAAQPWCSGKVGMQGISWGGFNALQVAALGPPALAAIITACSTDDRYADDIHYMGGCQLTDNLSWASNMLSFNACPPDPAVVGPAWRETWLKRLEASHPWLLTWLAHQRRDGYWRHGSVCEDFSAIQVPVMAVGGWRDGYSNAVFRLLAGLDVPRRGIVGSWGHRFPHLPGPGPEIDYLGEALRWWERWLKGTPNDVEHAPMLQAWMLDPSPPGDNAAPGRWVGEAAWPSPRIAPRVLTLAPCTLALEPRLSPPADVPLTHRSALAAGLNGGKWCVYNEITDLPRDQRADDAYSLSFDSPPLSEAIEVLGQPRLEIDIAADRPVAQLIARLCLLDGGAGGDANGSSARVTYGALNLTHREGHDAPQPLEPGRRTRVSVALNDIAQRFAPGNRIRLALSTTYWPMIWPAPEPVTLTLWPASARLILPVRPHDADDSGHHGGHHGGDAPTSAQATPLPGPARMAPPPPVTTLADAPPGWTVTHDQASGETRVDIVDDHPHERFEEHGGAVARQVRERFTAIGDDPAALEGRVEQDWRFHRDGHGAADYDVRIVTRSVMTPVPDGFRVEVELVATDDGVEVFRRRWEETAPRDLA